MFIKCSIGVKKNKENTRFIIFFPSLTICMLEKKKKKCWDVFTMTFSSITLFGERVTYHSSVFISFHTPWLMDLKMASAWKKRRSKSHFGAQLLPKISRLVLGAPLRMTLAKIYHFEARFIIYMSREASLRQGEILVKIICQNGFEQPAARYLVWICAPK